MRAADSHGGILLDWNKEQAYLRLRYTKSSNGYSNNTSTIVIQCNPSQIKLSKFCTATFDSLFCSGVFDL